MKLPSDEAPANMNGEGYISDEYDHLEMMPAPIRDGDFSEYMWMENEEEFNSQVLRQLEEEELMEQCIVAMLDDEYQMANTNSRSNTSDANVNSRSNLNESSLNSRSSANDNSNSLNGLSESVDNLSLSSNGVRSNSVSSDSVAGATNNASRSSYTAQDRLRRFRQAVPYNSSPNESEQKSTLNPDAKEFVPLTRNSPESATLKNENVSS